MRNQSSISILYWCTFGSNCSLESSSNVMPQAWPTFLWAVSPIPLCSTSGAPSGGMKSIGALSRDVHLESSVGSGWAAHSHSFTRLRRSHSWYPGCVLEVVVLLRDEPSPAAWCNRCASSTGLVMRGAWSPPNMTQVNLCLTWPENFVSHDPWILLANLKAGLCLRWTFHATWEQTGLSCASTRTRNNAFPLDVLVIANVLPVVTDTFFSGVQNGIDIWFHALQYTALICPATYILNLWHKDYLQRELLCCVSSFLILSRCEPSGGCGSASKAVTSV